MKITGRKPTAPPIQELPSVKYELYKPHLHNKDTQVYRKGQSDHLKYKSKGFFC